jgi:tetratricopeptide (TPR) repeat protein
MQLAYCDQRKKDGHLYYDVTSDTDLDLKVEHLRDELAELRRAFSLWQNKVLRAFAVGFFLLALIGGSVWWFGYSQHQDIQGIGKDARHITKEKIRAQLLESVERAREDAFAQAEKAKGWEERELLHQAAEKAYTGSVSRIDELAASFAEIDGTERSTQVFDEMTRILAEEGVDQALAYVATQRPAILEKVKARTADTREKNRTELLPLLKSAQLETERNHPAEAEHIFREILALEPDWSEPRNAFAWFLIERGEIIEPAQGNAKLREAVQICQGTLALNIRLSLTGIGAELRSEDSYAKVERLLPGGPAQMSGKMSVGDRIAAVAQNEEPFVDTVDMKLDKVVEMIRGKKGTVVRLQIIPANSMDPSSRRVVELVRDNVKLTEQEARASPQDWAETQNNLGNALWDLGRRSGAEEDHKLLADAVAAYRSALEVRAKADLPQDWAQTQNNLGNALSDLGTRSGGEEGHKLLADAVAAYRSALEVRTKADLPEGWAQTQNNLGVALSDLGTRSGGEEGHKLLADAVAAYRSALEVYTKADLPQD